MEIKSLKEYLNEWTDLDVAAYLLACSLGVMNPENGYAGYKSIFWTTNPLADLLIEILEKLVGIKILEVRDKPDVQYRWNSSFEANQFFDNFWGKDISAS